MKKYLIALIGIAASLNGITASAQTAAKHKTAGCPSEHRYTARHHVKHRHMVMKNETIMVDDHFKTATIEIKKGKVYYNDSLITDVKNPKWEDHNIIINYITPPPPPTPVADMNQIKTNTYTGNKGQAYLGVYACDACDDGAYIDDVVSCSPADKAGLGAGDVITKINDKDIKTKADLTDALSTLNSGDNVTITYDDGYGRTRTQDAELSTKDKSGNCGCDTHTDYPGCGSCYSRW